MARAPEVDTHGGRQAAAHITGVKAEGQGQSLYTLQTVREKKAAVTSEQGWPVRKLAL